MTTELHPEALGDHLDRLYRAALALCGTHEDAEDLVQDTCARVLARRRDLDGDPLPYLMAVLRHCFVSGLRRRDRRPRTSPLEAAAEPIAPLSLGPVEVLTAREVFAAVAALPKGFREVVAMVDVAGLSYAEAAAALGVPRGTVMSRLYRGRARVAEAMARSEPAPAAR